MQSDFTEDICTILLKKAEQFAQEEVNRQKWRGARGGVLPDGYDAPSIAAEALSGLLRKISTRPIETPYSLKELLEDLQGRVRALVNRLHHRKENSLLSNEPDLAPILTEDGETASLVEIVPTAQPGPAEELQASEEGREIERLQRQFNDFLSEDQPVKDLFGCLCDGITKRAAIARKLGLPVRQVKNASIRLKRRLAEFKKRF